MFDVWYEIEWLVPAENAIGGQGYWIFVCGEDRLAYREPDEAKARAVLARQKGGSYRLVRVTREVVEERAGGG